MIYNNRLFAYVLRNVEKFWEMLRKVAVLWLRHLNSRNYSYNDVSFTWLSRTYTLLQDENGLPLDHDFKWCKTQLIVRSYSSLMKHFCRYCFWIIIITCIKRIRASSSTFCNHYLLIQSLSLLFIYSSVGFEKALLSSLLLLLP